MKNIKILSVLALMLLAVTLLFTSCSSDKKGDDQSDNNDDAPKYEFPEDGVLTPLANGLAPLTTDGRNPSLTEEDKFVVFFDFAFEEAGLDLDENTEITYTARKTTGKSSEGVAKLDTSLNKIKNEHGYIGICIDIGLNFNMYDQATVAISFKDKSGKQFSAGNMSVHEGLYSAGFSAAKFDTYLKDTVKTVVGRDTIKQTGTINGNKYTFTIDLTKWARKTSVNQIVTCSRLFWECYPRMYERFSSVSKCSKVITFAVENEGYGIATATPTRVHLHDDWLANNPTDYDCLTHEFGHVAQNAWTRGYLEYDADIELFAEYCRYVYAFKNGMYNDDHWTLATATNETNREKSKRFLVWLDYTYSTKDNDVLLKYFTACNNNQYKQADWDKAWAEIFKGTPLEGKTIDEAFAIYKSSDFGRLSTKVSNGVVPLLQKYDVREKVKMFEKTPLEE